MSEANNTTSLSPPPVTIYSTEIVFSGLYCLIVGSFGIVANSVTIAAVWRNKKLQTPCFALLTAHAICSWLLATGFINDGVQRLGVYFKVLGNAYTRLFCYVMYIPKTISTPPSAIFTCAIGLDRLYGVVLPLQYKAHAKKFVLCSLIFGACVASANILAAGLTAPKPITGMITCVNYFAAFHSTFTKYYTNHNLAFCVLAVCIYASIVCIVKCRHLKSDTTDRFLQTQLSILPMIQAIMVAYICYGVCPEIMASVSSVIQNGVYQPKVVLYASMLKATSTCTDFCVLVFKCEEYKATAKRIFRVGSAVAPVSNHPVSTTVPVRQI